MIGRISSLRREGRKLEPGSLKLSVCGVVLTELCQLRTGWEWWVVQVSVQLGDLCLTGGRLGSMDIDDYLLVRVKQGTPNVADEDRSWCPGGTLPCLSISKASLMSLMFQLLTWVMSCESFHSAAFNLVVSSLPCLPMQTLPYSHRILQTLTRGPVCPCVTDEDLPGSCCRKCGII